METSIRALSLGLCAHNLCAKLKYSGTPLETELLHRICRSMQLKTEATESDK